MLRRITPARLTFFENIICSPSLPGFFYDVSRLLSLSLESPAQRIRSDMSFKENAPVENTLATIGAILWSIQIIPQIIKSYRSKSTLGLSAGLMA
jgi:hypothetical protein